MDGDCSIKEFRSFQPNSVEGSNDVTKNHHAVKPIRRYFLFFSFCSCPIPVFLEFYSLVRLVLNIGSIVRQIPQGTHSMCRVLYLGGQRHAPLEKFKKACIQQCNNHNSSNIQERRKRMALLEPLLEYLDLYKKWSG